MALARSRSEAPRQSLSAGDRGITGSQGVPIVIGQESAPEDAEDEVEPESRSPVLNSTVEDGFRPYGPVESFIPGFHQQRAVTDNEVIPWEPTQISLLTVDIITPRVMLDYRVLSPGWMFPERAGRPGHLDPSLYLPDLITKEIIRSLYAEKPWTALDVPSLVPLIFDPAESPRAAAIVDGYRTFEVDHRQAYWEATHSFPVTNAKKAADPWLASFYTRRKNRSSHAREKFRALEDQVLEEIRRTGCCDLDILLDPMFMRFPQQSEEMTWFPGREAIAEGRDPPQDLIAALADCNRAVAWRNHYHLDLRSHPSLRIGRLRLKFTSSDPDQE